MKIMTPEEAIKILHPDTTKEAIADAFTALILASSRMGGKCIECTLQYGDEYIDVDFSWKKHEGKV